jgi:glycosyltransferase involved in cell wall biosynthesis
MSGGLLLVSHDATRTGAPRVAIEILGSWRALPMRRSTILKAGGPLVNEFRRCSDEVVVHRSPVREWLWRRGFDQPRRGKSRLAGGVDTVGAMRTLRSLRPSLVWANTLVSADYAWAAASLGIPSILHCHELGEYIPTFVRRYRLHRLPERVMLVAVSSEVRTALGEAMGRDPNGIAVIPPPVDISRVRRLAGEEVTSPLPADAVLVTGCGTVDERKGPDLWLDVAKLVLSSGVPDRVLFLWIGEGPWLPRLREQVRRMKLEGRVLFVGSQENPYPLLSRSTVFTLTSRWDPFPIAVLESMALRTPVVAFGSGGVAEELGDAGIICGSGDVREMATHVVRLLEQTPARRAMVERGQERVATLYDVGRFDFRIRDVVTQALSVLAAGPSAPPNGATRPPGQAVR